MTEDYFKRRAEETWKTAEFYCHFALGTATAVGIAYILLECGVLPNELHMVSKSDAVPLLMIAILGFLVASLLHFRTRFLEEQNRAMRRILIERVPGFEEDLKDERFWKKGEDSDD